MTMIHSLSASPALRTAIKSDAANYLHLRALASGATYGLTRQRQALAHRCLQHFIADSARERTLARDPSAEGAAPLRINDIMARYWHGHVHRLFCDGLGSDSGAASGVQMRARRAAAPGFAEQAAVDTLNSEVKRRSHKMLQY
jgi:hypothetical protein